MVVKYYGYLINNWHKKNESKVTVNVYVDRETVKDYFKKEIVSILEEPPVNLSEKIKLIAKIDLNSKDYSGIQLADIVANGIQRARKRKNVKQFRKVFEEISGLKITVAKT